MSCSVTERVSENRTGAGGCRLRGSSSTSLATPPNSKGNAGGSAPSGSLRPKPCCLCWCCCCSCSCITPGKGTDQNGPTKNSNNSDMLSYDNEPPPTLEEIKSWGRSFDRLMRSPAGRKVFRDFLRCEYSEENILFWLACEDLKRESSPEAVEEKARVIYEDYISILSPKEVSLDSRVREIVNRNMVEPTPHTFDEAQLQIYTLMHRDSYPRFVNSAMYKNLARQGDNGGATSESGPAVSEPGPVAVGVTVPEISGPSDPGGVAVKSTSSAESSGKVQETVSSAKGYDGGSCKPNSDKSGTTNQGVSRSKSSDAGASGQTTSSMSPGASVANVTEVGNSSRG